MKTEIKVLMGFLLLGLFIASTSFFLANSTNERLVKTGLNHGEYLRMAQTIKSKAMGAVQESFAYVLSGMEVEKREYLDWDEDFASDLKGFLDFLVLHNVGAEGEKELIDQIITKQKHLSNYANKMFNEYEEKEAVSLKTFKKYESSIDEIDSSFQLLIECIEAEIINTQAFIYTEIRSDKIKIYALGTLTLVFCLVFGYFLYFQIKNTNRLREENENQLKLIANNTTSVIYMKDIEGRYLLINKRYEDLFDLKNQEVQGKTDLDLFPKEIADNFIKNDKNVMVSGIPFEGEENAPHKDGLHTYISIKVPLRNSVGVIYGICGISTDITELKKVFEKLKSSEEKLKSYFEMPLIGIAMTSPEKGWLEINQKLCEIFQYSKEELTQMTWTELTYPDDLKEDVAQFNRVLAGEIEGYSLDKRFIRKDKAIIHANISARCIRKSDGSVDYFVALVEDISERKKIEEQILNESKFTSENPFPTMRVSNKGTFIYFNKSADKIGQKYNCQIGHPIPQAWQDNLNKAFSSNKMIEFEDEIEEKTFNFNMVPIIDRDYLNIYGLDITSRKKAENELETFASIASHDLQAPLRKISLFGDRLKESAVNLDERSKEYIQRMQNSAQQMSHFIDDMLNFSVISAEQIPFETIDLQERIKEICEELNHIILSARGKINFSNLPAVEGNKIQIDQLFINLIINALKYKHEDKNPIINIYQENNIDGFYELHIEDNGIGFDQSFADRVFEPFQRLHSRSKYNGTGLGLTICKKIVDRHNGSISVKSSPEKGTTFIIKFPLKQKSTVH
jgi:PAS domain S-box-containing protein